MSTAHPCTSQRAVVLAAAANTARVADVTGVDPDCIAVIIVGVDVGWIDGTRYGIELVPFRLLATGRLLAGKGMDSVLEAFAGVRKQWPNATLVIAGA